MAAPKNPNTGPAAAKNARKGQETAARKLRAAGWVVTPPEEVTATPDKSAEDVR